MATYSSARRAVLEWHSKRGECQRDHRVKPICLCRNGNGAVIGVRVVRGGSVHHDNVLTRPQRGKTAFVRRGGDGIDHRPVGAGPDPQRMQSELHRTIVSRRNSAAFA
jgi:hypothetical protein